MAAATEFDDAIKVLLLLLSLLLAALGTADGRHMRQAPLQELTVSTNYFEENYRASDEAFQRAFRISRPCFEKLAKYLRSRWRHYYGHAPENNSSKYSLELKMGLTLRYLGSRGFLVDVAGQFGVSVATASRAYFAIYRVLYDDGEYFVRFPRDESEWKAVSDGFQRVAGFDRVVDAIDGTSLNRSRPSNIWDGTAGKTLQPTTCKRLSISINFGCSWSFLELDVEPHC